MKPSSCSTVDAAATGAAPALPWALLALAVGAFGIGTTEFAPMGLLPTIADGVGVSIPAAGLLVSAYAIGVMVGAPLMTIALARLPQRVALVLLMAVFTLGNLLSAIAPGYATLMVARVVTSLAHGAFFGIGALVATRVVPPQRRASAVATMFMGLTIANVGGVPAAAWIGQTVGWRAAFAASALLGVIAAVAVWLAVPPAPADSTAPDLRGELRVLSRPAVLAALGTTVLGASAMFALYTYVVPVLHEVTGASTGFVTAMLVLVGVGFTIGNALGGRLADRSIDGSLILFLALLGLLLLVFPLAARNQVAVAIALLVFGALTFAVVPPLQMRVMQAAAEAPGLASSVNIGAFNVGNAVGAAAGGAAIGLGAGPASVAWVGALLALMGLALVLATRSAGASRAGAGGAGPGA